MVSRIPTLSGKRFGRRIPRDKVLPVLVIGVLLVALLASYPFSFLAVTGFAYLAHIPFAWRARNLAGGAASARLRSAAEAGGIKPANCRQSAQFRQKARPIILPDTFPMLGRDGDGGALRSPEMIFRVYATARDRPRGDGARRRSGRLPRSSASSW